MNTEIIPASARELRPASLFMPSAQGRLTRSGFSDVVVVG
jgi:hypothetical protein